MKWEYLEVYIGGDGTFIAFDGNSQCDGDKSLIVLLNRLGQDRWEYCYPIGSNERLSNHSFHLLKRSLP